MKTRYLLAVVNYDEFSPIRIYKHIGFAYKDMLYLNKQYCINAIENRRKYGKKQCIDYRFIDKLRVIRLPYEPRPITKHSLY